ncbi:MAG: hypothetical protein JWO31_2831, partial [Phycisphaerales bacterium]|nr:hypothetical protein [Phycisphaerales bacterium]
PADATLGDAGDGTVQGDPGEQGTETTEADQVVPAEPEPAGEPGINDVVRDVAAEPDPIGFLQREPMPYLSPDESRLQAKLFNVLARRGLLMRDQGGVYPYLLRQIAGSLAD